MGYIPEVPGVNAQERTLDAARESLTIALRELIEIDPSALLVHGRRFEEIRVAI